MINANYDEMYTERLFTLNNNMLSKIDIRKYIVSNNFKQPLE